MREVIERHGRLDILVNNAGVTSDRSVLKMSDDDWHRVLEVNLSGSVLPQPGRAAPHARTRQRPDREHLLGDRQHRNIGQANYAASKSGLFGLTMTLAR